MSDIFHQLRKAGSAPCREMVAHAAYGSLDVSFENPVARRRRACRRAVQTKLNIAKYDEAKPPHSSTGYFECHAFRSCSEN